MQIENKKVAVLGGGSWGTAIVKILTSNLNQVHWWMRNNESLEHLRMFGHNPNYLSSASFDPQQLVLHKNIENCISQVDTIILATPAAFIHGLLKNVPLETWEGKKVFSAVKGIIPQNSAIPARYVHKKLKVPYSHIGIICGPCHAEEVAQEKLSYLTVACQDEFHANEMAQMLNNRYIRTTISDDLFGTELSVILKNVYALAAGILHGLGYGDNFQAVLMSNAILEMESFIDEVSPVHRDVKSSAYLGDLLVTAYSQFSRNRTFGTMIGRGYTVKSAMMEMKMIAEGYYATKGIVKINKKFNVDLPIVEAVNNILYKKIAPAIEMRILAESFK